MTGKSANHKVVELFAGIGGWHNAIKMSKIFQVSETAEEDNLDVLAVDISDIACNIYRHNFPKINICCKSIESFDCSIFEGKGSQVPAPTAILAMSPPCQPFTRIGLKRDLDDKRTNGLKHVCDLLRKLFIRCKQECLPRMIVVENVAGFETSSARDLLIETLILSGYAWREYLLSPFDLGIPNSRTRYYLAAGKLLDSEAAKPGEPIHIPPFENLAKSLISNVVPSDEKRKTIAEYLEKPDGETGDRLTLKPEKHLRYAKVLDIVLPNSPRSMCFTSSYARYMEGTGSVLQSSFLDEEAVNEENNSETRCEVPLEKREELITSGKLRFFSPREVANLMCFPNDFDWPKSASDRQLYKCLGNSINCFVSSQIVKVASEIWEKNKETPIN